MAQALYSGIQGSGKSYEVVRGVIVPNIAKGRRIVTNVAGLQYEKICDYIRANYKNFSPEFGQIVKVENDDISKENFFPLEESENPFTLDKENIRAIVAGMPVSKLDDFKAELAAKAQAWRDSFIVRGGDIIVLDEVWRWYSTGEKLPENHLKFFRMHRHFLHPETGQCCDIVLVAQDIGDLQRKIRATIEKSFLMQKHIDLGLPGRYVVNIYSGNRQTPKALIESIQEKYQPEIFALYSSHSQKKEGDAGPKEERADSRGNAFNTKIIKIGLPLAVLMMCGSGFYLWKFLHPAPPPAAAVAAVDPKKTPALGSASEVKKEVPGFSNEWRLSGSYSVNGLAVYLLTDNNGRLRHVSNPSAVKFSAGEVELMLPDGSFVSQWSGVAKKGLLP